MNWFGRWEGGLLIDDCFGYVPTLFGTIFLFLPFFRDLFLRIHFPSTSPLESEDS
jgi:hypothetical protein